MSLIFSMLHCCTTVNSIIHLICIHNMCRFLHHSTYEQVYESNAKCQKNAHEHHLLKKEEKIYLFIYMLKYWADLNIYSCFHMFLLNIYFSNALKMVLSFIRHFSSYPQKPFLYFCFRHLNNARRLYMASKKDAEKVNNRNNGEKKAKRKEEKSAKSLYFFAFAQIFCNIKWSIVNNCAVKE